MSGDDVLTLDYKHIDIHSSKLNIYIYIMERTTATKRNEILPKLND